MRGHTTRFTALHIAHLVQCRIEAENAATEQPLLDPPLADPVLAPVADAADAAPLKEGKLFVGGTSWDTTKQSLEAYFCKFGKITDSVIMTDRNTGKPRGFGFITFEDDKGVHAG